MAACLLSGPYNYQHCDDDLVDHDDDVFPQTLNLFRKTRSMGTGHGRGRRNTTYSQPTHPPLTPLAPPVQMHMQQTRVFRDIFAC